MKQVGGIVLSVCAALVGLLVLIHALDPGRDQVVAAQTLPNVIVVMVDALRPDHVSSYGYTRPTTPNLDQWLSAKGTRFVDVSSTSSWTYPANAALLTGRMPTNIGVMWHDNSTQIPESETMLAERLKAVGYSTAGFVNAYYVWPNFGFGQGFDTYQTPRSGSNGNAAVINDAAFRWLDEVWQPSLQANPIFLYLYYYDPHTVYAAPPPYDTMYDSSYTGTLTSEVYQNAERVVSGEIVPTERDIEHLKAMYDGEITYWDVKFGEMMDRLTELGILDNAIVILTADHGQMFGEHNHWTHHNALFEEVIRVPMVITWPGVVTAGEVISAPVTTMDITPTLMDMLDLGVPAGLDGQSLLPLMNGEPGDPQRPIYSELSGATYPGDPHFWAAPRYEERSIKKGSWKFIHQIRNDAGDVLYLVQPQSLYETENLIDMVPDEAEELRGLLYDWFTVPTEFVFTPSVHSDGPVPTVPVP